MKDSRAHLSFTFLLIAFILSSAFNAHAQTNEWTWVSGSKTANSAGSYGTIHVGTSTTQPPARDGAASWTDSNGNYWLFGGQNSGGQNNDLWEYNISTGYWIWQGGVQSGTSALGVYNTQGSPNASSYPGTRAYMSYATDPFGNFWLFGGQGFASSWATYGYLNDIWEYNPSTSEWTWWGGSINGSPNNNYGALGVASTAYYPSGRIYSDMWVDSSRNVWLFGGYENGFSNTGNDMWEFNSSNLKWAWVNGSTSLNANPTYTSATLANVNPGGVVNNTNWKDLNGNLWSFAGQLAYVPTNSLWSYNTGSNLWTYENSGLPENVSLPIWTDYGTWGTLGTFASPNIPAPVYSMASTVDPLGDVWFMGGFGYNLSKNANYLNALWAYDPDLNDWAWMGGSSTIENNTGVYGTKGSAAPTNVPGARILPNLFAQSNGNIWLFGGYGYDSNGTLGYLNDLWSISPTSLVSTNTPVISPASGSYTAPLSVSITDSTSGALIYYTTNGTVPTSASTLYSTAFSLPASATVCAIAIAPGDIQSPVVCNTYTLTAAPVYIWLPPTSITYGHNLSTVLTASASIPGTWAYDIGGGGAVYASTVLPVGVYQFDAVFTSTTGGITHKLSYRIPVNPVTLTVQPANKSVVYDSQVASYAYTITGYVNGDTSSTAFSGYPTIDTTATIRSATTGYVYYTSNIGNYSITSTWGSLKSANYTFSFKTATLTITPSPTYITVQPNNLVVGYDYPIPTLTYKYSGLLNWDTVAGQLSGTPTITTTAVKGSPKGNYTITSAAGTLKQLYNNYAGIHYATATLTIN